MAQFRGFVLSALRRVFIPREPSIEETVERSVHDVQRRAARRAKALARFDLTQARAEGNAVERAREDWSRTHQYDSHPAPPDPDYLERRATDNYLYREFIVKPILSIIAVCAGIGFVVWGATALYRMLPPWLALTLDMAVCAAAFVALVRLVVRTAQRMRRKPVSTSIAVSACVLVAAFGWLVAINLPRPLELGRMPAGRAVSRNVENGAIVCRLWAYPHQWSQAVTVPDNVERVDVLSSAGARVRVSIDGKISAPAHIVPRSGTRLRFSATSPTRVPIAVRFQSFHWLWFN